MTLAEQIAERPIIFSGEMVRAILGGRKTQTRRVIQYPHSTGAFVCVQGFWQGMSEEWWPLVSHDGESVDDGNGCEVPMNCPYGVPGDRLWVRETWQQYDGPAYGDGKSDPVVIYRADTHDMECGDEECSWRPSIFMPRWASRITLEIVKVRVEHVQDIGLEDVQNEGLIFDPRACLKQMRMQFAHLWDSINVKRGFGWDKNPWVWVIEFKRILEQESGERNNG